MKPYQLLFFIIVIVVTSCSKSTRAGTNCDEYYINKMKKQWAPLSSCSPEFNHVLGKGIYQAKVIYYTDISCIACNTAPPQYGVTCAGDSVRVNNWNDVKDRKIIATCRNL
ncbi:MAG TPA: hypothetical protein PKE30_21915 [Niabella sp.]|nr:hypothetical protein [Niabella sp.]